MARPSLSNCAKRPVNGSPHFGLIVVIHTVRVCVCDTFFSFQFFGPLPTNFDFRSAVLYVAKRQFCCVEGLQRLSSETNATYPNDQHLQLQWNKIEITNKIRTFHLKLLSQWYVETKSFQLYLCSKQIKPILAPCPASHATETRNAERNPKQRNLQFKR